MAINGSPRPFAIAVGSVIAVGGLLLGIGTTVFFFGGAVRQVDINTRLLETIERDGSPPSQALKLQFIEFREQFNALRRDLRPREFWENQASDLAELKTQMKRLEGSGERAAPEWIALLQRVSSLEAHFNDYAQNTRDNLRSLSEQVSRLERSQDRRAP